MSDTASRPDDEKLQAAFNKTIVHLRSHKIAPLPQNYQLVFAHYGRAQGIETNDSVSKTQEFYRHSTGELTDGVTRLSTAAVDYERGASELVSALLVDEAHRDADRITDLERRCRELSQNLSTAVEQIDELKSSVKQFETRASLDPLTGLLNRWGLENAYADLLAEHAAGPHACVIGDLDHFKSINDTHGHPIGDKVLVHVAKLIRANARAGLVARFGGEEFLLILPNTTGPNAVTVAEKIRKELARQCFVSGEARFDVTISFGVAETDPECALDRVYMDADQNLYRAKVEGRNRVVFDNNQGDEAETRQAA